MNSMTYFHLFIVRVLPYTETKGYQISIRSPRFKQRVVIDWNERFDYDSKQWAKKYLESKGFVIIGGGLLNNDDSDILISTTFEPLRAEK